MGASESIESGLSQELGGREFARGDATRGARSDRDHWLRVSNRCHGIDVAERRPGIV